MMPQRCSMNQKIQQNTFLFPSKKLWVLLTKESNLNYFQKTGNLLKTNEQELLKFARMIILLGTISVPQARLFWTKLLNFPLITRAMSRDFLFFQIKKSHSFCEQFGDQRGEKKTDKLRKIKPLLRAMPRSAICSK